ncbi:hypothetical protein SMD22_01540 (plasmid) [Brevibacillus halotolerans]|nr:hypothetical protein SMD22_01540 [Brevibacillus halotolerans]
MKGENKKQGKRKSPYTGVLRDFIRQTINDPSFFDLPPEEQKKFAKGVISKHKVVPFNKTDIKREIKE